MKDRDWCQRVSLRHMKCKIPSILLCASSRYRCLSISAISALGEEMGRRTIQVASGLHVTQLGDVRGSPHHLGGHRRFLGRSDPLTHVVEARVLREEGELGGAGRPVTVLGHDDLGHAAPIRRRLLVVGLLSIEEEHHIGVLLERA